MVRVRSQLAIQASPALLNRLRAAATAQGRTTTSVAVEALEAWLAGVSGAPSDSVLLARFEALERRLEALEARAVDPVPADLREPIGLPRTQVAQPAPPSPSRPADPVVHGDGSRLTSAELARLTETNRGSWNNWAGNNAVGSVWHHHKAGSWRLVGKEPSNTGGPARWLWERAA